MKKLLILIIILTHISLYYSCSSQNKEEKDASEIANDIIIIDHCEYLIVELGRNTRWWTMSITHKGNCSNHTY